jgi:hypothetical protein
MAVGAAVAAGHACSLIASVDTNNANKFVRKICLLNPL